MVDGTVTTGVDDLLEYLKGQEKVAMQDAAGVLGIPMETLQAWVDFLVTRASRLLRPTIAINLLIPLEIPASADGLARWWCPCTKSGWLLQFEKPEQGPSFRRPRG